MTSRSEGTSEVGTLVDLLRFRAQDQPARRVFTYLADGPGTDGSGTEIHLAFHELDRQARAIAVELSRRARPGERALLLYPPGLEFISAYFGCLYAGVVAVPANPPRANRPMPQLEAVVRDARPVVLLTSASMLAEAQRRFSQVADLQDMPCLASDAVDQAAADDWRSPVIEGDSLAFLQYTSGSTALPKGVMVTHGNLLHNLSLMHDCFGFTQDDVALSWVPPYHDMGLIGALLGPVYAGLHCIHMSPMAFLQRPMSWLEAMSRHRVASTTGPNFAYELCVAKSTPEQRVKLDLSAWRIAICGSEPIRAGTLERFAEAFAVSGFRRQSFCPCYGLGESTLIVSGTPRRRPPLVRPVPTTQGASPAHWAALKVSCGPPLGDQQVVIADPESCARLGERQVGEVWVRGPSVAQGYWQRPEENARSFQARLADGDGPYLRTGDLGFLDGGELYITGRIKELIIIRGRNHYPQDIEQTVSVAHPALHIGAGAAFAIEAEGEERLAVAHEVQRSHRRGLDVDEVAAAIRRDVSQHHGIDVHAVALLKPGGVPRTSSGKIQRAACRESFLAGTLDPLAQWTAGAIRKSRPDAGSAPQVDVAPRVARTASEIQTWLGQRLAERLHVPSDDIDHRADFKSFALDSQDAIGLSGELEDWLGRRLSPTLLYDYATIETLAAHLAGAAASAGPNSGTRSIGTEGTSAAATWPRHAEPIAIVGLGCRFPGGANDPASFWKLLQGGVDAIREAPGERWDVDEFYDPDPAAPGKMSTRWGGFLNDVDKFDASFFGIAPREAASMDPQQRMFLEVSWEALEHAGQAPDRLFGSQTGVFLGVCTSDYMQLLHASGDRTRIDAYYGTGSAFSVASGRLSYVLGLQGPNLPVDTACSSSLVAVHLAAQSLRSGECRMALAGGVNMLLSPDAMIYFSKVHAMAADGRCKAFDAAADGYVRGEGCGVVVLKRLSDALTDGDTVLALIRGSAINHDGRSNGLTAPNGISQERVIRQALQVAGLEPATIDYVEAHGTGTALGDPIEARALTAALGEGRPADRPLLVGSVKTNIGHLEAAAGVAGLIKSVLALRQGEVPANLHFQRLNPHIPADESAISIPVRPAPWTRGERPRRAGVSSFGFGGTNAHVIIEEAPLQSAPASPVDRPLHILTLSAKTPAALTELAQRYVDCLSAGNERIQDVCFTANVGRAQLPHRLTVVGESAAAVEDALWAYRAGQASAGVQTGHAPRGSRPKVALLFSGQGGERVGQARELYDTQPVFRRALDRCDAVARTYLMSGGRGGSLVDALYPHGRSGEAFTDAMAARIALFAVEYALSELWRSWGVEPAAAVGHGVGRQAAACAMDECSLEDALRQVSLASTNNESAATERFNSDMLALANSDIAAFIVIGPSAELTTIARRALPGSTARFVPSLRKGQADWRTLLDSLATLHVAGVEIDWAGFDREYPRIKVALPTYPFQRERHWFDTSRTSAPSVADAASVGDMSVSAHATERNGHGQSGAHRNGAHHENGKTPDQRRIDPPALLRTASVIQDRAFDYVLTAGNTPLLDDHEVFGTCIVPGAWYVATALETGRQALGSKLALEDLSLPRPLALSPGERRQVHVEWTVDGGQRASFRMASHPADEKRNGHAGLMHAAGYAQAMGGNGQSSPKTKVDLAELRGRCAAELPGAAWYRFLADLDIRLGPTFQWHTTIWRGTDEAVGRLERPWGATGDAEGGIEPALIDACFQLVGAALVGGGGERAVWVPVGLDRLELHHSPAAGAELWAHARLRGGREAAATTVQGDVRLVDAAGRVAMTIEGVHLQRVSAAAMLAAASKGKGGATQPKAAATANTYRLEVAQKGVIDGLKQITARRHAPVADQVEIAVRATGLNFRDVLNVLGLYPGDPGPLGGECSGMITAVGPDVKGLSVGERVLAIAPGSFAGHVTTRAALVAKMPADWSFEDAAATPIAFLTAHYALNRLAELKPGERVLIHAATGGVGLAALEIARHVGAEVFATAGSPAKRDHLAALGVRHVMDSRSTDFAAQIRQATDGQGVDVVLNSLAGPAIEAGMSILAPGGRFLEIGKSDPWDAARVAAVNPAIAYHAIALDTLAHDQPQLVGQLLYEVLAAFGRGDWQRLPRRDYPLDQAQAAFRYMAQARHIGKLVIVPPVAPPVLADGPDRSTAIVPSANGATQASTPPRLTGQVRAAVLAAPDEDRPRLVEEYLRENVARALDVPPADVDADARLNDLGFDSLMAVEVKNHIELDLGVNFNLAGFLEGPTLAGLVAQVLEQLDGAAAEPVPQAITSLDPQQLLDNIDSLSDDEVDTLLNQMLAEVGEATDG